MNLDADSSPIYIHIDGTDVATEGTFVSSVTGRNLTYLPWIGGEPNNWGNEDCINIYRDSGKWNDIPCDRQLPSVCEKCESYQIAPNSIIEADLYQK